MKKRTHLLLPLLLSLIPLSGCDGAVYHSLSVNAEDELVHEMPHLFNKKPQKRFKAGDSVYFEVNPVCDADVVVYLNEELLSHVDGEYCLYCFAMPDMDSTIYVSIHTCPGGGPICRPDESW